jgi:hypothetical protein
MSRDESEKKLNLKSIKAKQIVIKRIKAKIDRNKNKNTLGTMHFIIIILRTIP